MEKLLKGMFFKELLDQVKETRGNPGVKALERNYGAPLEFSAFKDYPVENHLKLLKQAAVILYGQADPDSYLKIGILSFQTFSQSLIGKTLLTLYANNLRKAASAISKLWEGISNFGVREAYDLGRHRAKITIKKDPRPPEYLAGVLMGAAQHFGETAKVETRVLGVDDYEFMIDWQNNPKG